LADRVAGAYAAASRYEVNLTQQLIDGLLQIPGVKVQGITDVRLRDRRVPTVSITHPGHRNSVLARALAAQGINVWSGHNYALEVARRLGLDETEGVLRIGLAHYNTVDEIERILAALGALLRP
jgi:selenocysteine lyase/cysteine desulfurase